MVERLLHRAILSLDSCEDPDLKFFGVRTSWPKFPRDWHAHTDDPDEEPEAFTPSPADLSVMLDVLAWANGLTGQQWRIVADMARGYSAFATADRLHVPVDQVRRRYAQALDDVCRAAIAVSRLR